MGCIVNGPGEMADADFGYVGGAPGKIDLYVGKVSLFLCQLNERKPMVYIWHRISRESKRMLSNERDNKPNEFLHINKYRTITKITFLINSRSLNLSNIEEAVIPIFVRFGRTTIVMDS